MLQRLCRRCAVSAAVGTLCVLSLAAMCGLAQSQDAQLHRPEFEVASVRPSGPDQHVINALFTYPGGRVAGYGCRLQFLIMMAYNVEHFQISGGPAWTDAMSGDSFDIQAKPPESSLSAQWKTVSPKLPPGEEERRMLQSLLADRFQLQVHRGEGQGPVYFLTRGGSRLKLSTPKDKNEYSWAGGVGGGLPDGEGLRGTNISMPELATRLSGWLRRPVIDKTGLQGSFDFETSAGEDDAHSSADTYSSILTSIKEIGLNLEPGKGPVETIVIDHAERPSSN